MPKELYMSGGGGEPTLTLEIWAAAMPAPSAPSSAAAFIVAAPTGLQPAGAG